MKQVRKCRGLRDNLRLLDARCFTSKRVICAARALWESYFPQVDAVIYLVDAVDRERFPEAKRELNRLLSTEGLANTPFLVLGNKIDMPYAASEAELRSSLGLMETTGKEAGASRDVRPIEVYMCSILKKTGYDLGLKWLTAYLK
jgi:GTP-binding protein SAR1